MSKRWKSARLALAALLLLPCVQASRDLPSEAGALLGQSGDAYVVLARHAEKLDGDDPGLTNAGIERAEALSHVLSPWPIEAVYASQYLRTQATAAPLAERIGVTVEVVDARDVSGLVERIRSEGRSAVAVIGHSNTVPALIRELGIEEALSIPDHQYDDLFVVRLTADGGAHLMHFKYGAPTPD